MIIYLIISFGLFFATFIKNRYEKFFIILTWAFLGFVGAFRELTVGTDVKVYMLNYGFMTFDVKSWNMYTYFEPGFNYFIAFFKEHISSDYRIFIGTVFIISISAIFFSIKKNSQNPLVSVLFFVLLGYLGHSFNLMRQMLGLSLILCFFPYVEKSKIKFIAVILVISILIHNSLILLLLLVFYDYIKRYMTTKVLIGILLASLVIFLTNFEIQNVLQYAVSKIPLFDSKYNNYISREASNEFSQVSNIFHTLFCILIIIILKKNTKNIYLYAYVIGIVLINIMGSIDPVFARVGELFLIFRIFLFAEIWDYGTSRFNRNAYRSIIVSYGFLVLLNALIKNYDGIVPYANWLF